MGIVRVIWFVALTLSLNLPVAWAASGEEITVAVLPFERISHRRDDAFLQAGFAETITTALARVQGLQLIERGQLKRVLGEMKLQHSGLVDEATAVKIGGLLGARQLVLGAYQRAGSNIRVTCRLVDTGSGRVDPEHTVQVTRQLARDGDLFRIQDEVCRALLGSFGIRPTAEQMQLLSQVTHAATNLSAYDYYIQAREQYLLSSPEGYARAVSLFDKAIAADPKFALAWAGLAETHAGWGVQKEQVGEDPVPEYRKAEECAEKAVALAPDLADVHHALAHIRLGWQGAPPRQPRAPQSRKGPAHNPRLAAAWFDWGLDLAKQGKLDEAVAAYRKAIGINPRFALAHINLGNALSDQGNLDEATAAYRRAIMINPQFALAHFCLGNALGKQGRLDEAAVAYRKAIGINPRQAVGYYNLGLTLAKQAKPDEAGRALQQCLGIARRDPSQREWIPRAEAALRELGAR